MGQALHQQRAFTSRQRTASSDCLHVVCTPLVSVTVHEPIHTIVTVRVPIPNRHTAAAIGGRHDQVSVDATDPHFGESQATERDFVLPPRIGVDDDVVTVADTPFIRVVAIAAVEQITPCSTN
ncbi:hypothetical protein D3C71_1497140 [compost metagenome]